MAQSPNTSGSLPPRFAGPILIATAFLGGFSFWPALIALGSLFETFSDQFGWSRSQVTTAQLIFTAASVVTAPVIGPLIDRVGVRPLLLAGLCLVPLTLAAVATNDGSYANWVAAWILASLAGQLVAPPVWSAGIARSFSRRRGLALGIAACGFAAASAATPLILVHLLGTDNWRSFYLAMGAFLLVVLLPLTFLGFRETLPAHDATRSPDLARPVSPSRAPGFVRNVVGTRPFLFLGTAVFLVSFVVGGMMIHLQPIFRAGGLSPGQAATAYTFYGIGGFIGRLGGGWLLDRFDRTPAPALPMCLFPVLACLLMFSAGQSSMLVHAAAALLIGAAAGVEVDVVPYLARRYFGVEVFGRAYLTLAAIFVGGAGLSPFLVSLWFDATGSYLGFLGASIVMGLLAAAMLRLLGPYPPGPAGKRDTPQNAR